MSEPAFRCADAARGRGDRLTGTAPPATRWLLIEYPDAWQADALRGSTIDPRVRDRLIAAAERAGVRILLIRRPTRRGSSPPDARLWTVLTRGAGTVSGRWRDDHDLLEAAEVLAGPAPSAGPSAVEPMILVCTHGVHDVCCALRGRPVALALAQRWPEATWECSHVGGDRFAANLAVLPDGFYYGNLDTESAGEVVAGHLAGQTDAGHLRGVSGYPPPGQAAMTEVYRRQTLPAGSVDVTSVTGNRRQGWTVGLQAEGLTYRAFVDAVPGPVTQLTCRAVREGSATGYRLRDFNELGPAG